VLKLIGVVVSYASGNAGGIFGPALFLGAMLGGAVGKRSAQLIPGVCGYGGSLRVSGNGDDVRRHCASANDVGGHDLRDDPRLFRDRSTDDFKSGQLFCFIALSTPTHLRSPCVPGRNTLAFGGVPRQFGPEARFSGDASGDRDFNREHDGTRSLREGVRQRTASVAREQ